MQSMLEKFPCERLVEVSASLEPAFGVPRECVLPCLRELQNQIESLRPGIETALAQGEVEQVLAALCSCSEEVVGRAEELRVRAAAAAEHTSENEPNVELAADSSSTAESADGKMQNGVPFVAEDDRAQSESTEAEVPDIIERTQSQCTKRRKVDAVADSVNECHDPVNSLRQTLSVLEQPTIDDEDADLSHTRAVAKLSRAFDELKQVEKLQQSFHHFGEDLMEGMIALDQLTGLAEQDRHVRKATLRSIQDLFDEIDNAKPRVVKLHERITADVARLRFALAAAPPAIPDAPSVAQPVANVGTPLDASTAKNEALLNEDFAACMVEVASVDTFSDVSSEAGQAVALPVPMAAVVSSSLDVGGDQPMFEDAELRGDATEEFGDLLKHYPNVTQAYRLGCVALSLGAGADCAGSAVSKILVKNAGAVPWPESSSLRSVAGPSRSLPELMLGEVPAGDTVEIVLDLAIKEGDGGRSAWAMCDGRGEPFGPLLLFEIVYM